MKKDLNNVNENDLFTNSNPFNKPTQEDENSGLSMKELFEKKRLEAEKKLEEAGKQTGKQSGPSQSEIEERKARLLA